MIFNNGYPASYQPFGYNYQPQIPQQMQGTQMSPANQQMMTPPTIRAEIIQVDDETAAENYPVGAGSSQMMIAKDDSAIFVKTSATNGNGYTLDVFVKRPRTPQKASFDPDRYVTREELESRLQAILTANNNIIQPLLKEEENNGNV